jgi:hypothetical protein
MVAPLPVTLVKMNILQRKREQCFRHIKPDPALVLKVQKFTTPVMDGQRKKANSNPNQAAASPSATALTGRM